MGIIIIRPIYEVVEIYEVDAIYNLYSICPNFYAMVRRRFPLLRIGKFKKFL